MKILKNLLGENAKIHSDSIFLESGSNDDGYWVKLPDGRKKCLLLVELNELEMTTSAGVLYRSSSRTWNFPIPFEEPPIVSTEANLNWIGWATLASNPTKNSMGYVGMYPLNGIVPGPVSFYLEAEGR